MKTSMNQSRRPIRRDRTIQERVHDPYKSSVKRREPAQCRDCGAVYEAGRWRWGVAPPKPVEDTCPACHRVADGYPAGLVHLTGGFVAEHLDEILNLLRNEAQSENREHPLKRIMAIDEADDGIIVSTTDLHLARSLGDALHRAYAGTLDYQYTKGNDLLRVGWRRAGE